MLKDSAETDRYPRVVLLMGKEGFLVSWALRCLREAVINPAAEVIDATVLDGSETNLDAIIAACEAYPLLSTRHLVAVTGSSFLAASDKSFSADELTKLADYLPTLPETTMLVLTANSVDKRKGLYKSIEKTGIVYDFTPLDDDMLAGWMSKRMTALQHTAGRSDLLRFARQNGYGDDNLDYNLYNLENDLIKACALAEKETLSFEDLCAACPPALDTDAFRLLDSAFSGNKSDAFTILHNSVDAQQPSKVQSAVLGLTGLLCAQLEIMLEAKERSDKGQSFDSIQAAMGTNSYRLRKAIDASRGRSAETLRKNLEDAFNIDKLMRTGEMDPGLAMEVFIASL